MPTLPLYLLSYRVSALQRAHFALWTPFTPTSDMGTKIHVVGAPMVGFVLQFQRGYNPQDTGRDPDDVILIGNVDVDHVHVSGDGVYVEDDVPKAELERVAKGIEPPGPSRNFLAPVNDTTNRRCQEWTMEFVRKLVALGYLEEEAVDIVQSERDPPSFGIGLRPVMQQVGEGAGVTNN